MPYELLILENSQYGASFYTEFVDTEQDMVELAARLSAIEIEATLKGILRVFTLTACQTTITQWPSDIPNVTTFDFDED